MPGRRLTHGSMIHSESRNNKSQLRRTRRGFLLWVMLFSAILPLRVWAEKPTPSSALQTLRDEVNRNPTSASSHYRLGVALYRGGAVAEAQGEFEAAIKLDPRLAEAHNNLGVILREKKAVQEAIQQFREAIEIRPQF